MVGSIFPLADDRVDLLHAAVLLVLPEDFSLAEQGVAEVVVGAFLERGVVGDERCGESVDRLVVVTVAVGCGTAPETQLLELFAVLDFFRGPVVGLLRGGKISLLEGGVGFFLGRGLGSGR